MTTQGRFKSGVLFGFRGSEPSAISKPSGYPSWSESESNGFVPYRSSSTSGTPSLSVSSRPSAASENIHGLAARLAIDSVANLLEMDPGTAPPKLLKIENGQPLTNPVEGLARAGESEFSMEKVRLDTYLLALAAPTAGFWTFSMETIRLDTYLFEPEAPVPGLRLFRIETILLEM